MGYQARERKKCEQGIGEVVMGCASPAAEMKRKTKRGRGIFLGCGGGRGGGEREGGRAKQ